MHHIYMFIFDCIIISTNEDPSLRIQSFTIINLASVNSRCFHKNTYFNLIFTMQHIRNFVSLLVRSLQEENLNFFGCILFIEMIS